MINIHGYNVPTVYTEAWWQMRICGVQRESRNGPVTRIPGPVCLTINEPTERVLFDPHRDCNPFFHVMETVWMFAGSDKVEWIEQFNKNYRNYAEADGTVWGAYGNRWLGHFNGYPENPLDQITKVVAMLKADATDRRAVIAMWDPTCDLGEKKNDLPCNTHIYFEVDRGFLNMTVCNRSNDMVWGMLGANAVHMTYLQELVARGVGVQIGEYRVVSNNLHVYHEREDVKKLWDTSVAYDFYAKDGLKPFPLLQPNEKIIDLLDDCESLVNVSHDDISISTVWAANVAYPMREAYLDKEMRNAWIQQIAAEDWRRACEEWVDRREVIPSPNPLSTASQDS